MISSTPRAEPPKPSGKSLPTDGPELPAGTTLRHYRIVRPLARGGMGVVYEAHDPNLRRSVALKVLPEALGVDPEMRERFLREARAAARLNHPNVVSVYEVGEQGTLSFLAMELVHGGSAEARLRERGPFPWPQATRLIADVCRGLAAAHAAGVVHRDIKPANILMADSVDAITPKLADFGLSKATAPGVSLTQSGLILGTPLYMSPEQCRSDPVDARSDLYSLGATYYSLLTGRGPYAGDSPMQAMFSHCSAPIPDVRDVMPDVPEACAAVIHRAMAKDPAERFPNAKGMLRALEAVLKAPASPTAKPAPPLALWDAPTLIQEADTLVLAPRGRARRRIMVGMASGGVLLLALGLGIAFMPGSRTPTRTKHAGLVPVGGTRATPHVLYVVAPKEFWNDDLGTIRAELERQGIRVSVGCPTKTAKPDGRAGGSWTRVDVCLCTANAADFDAIVFDGGVGTAHFYKGESIEARKAQGLAREMLAAGKPVAALAIGSTVLASADIVKGKHVTGHDNYGNVRGLLEKAGAIYVEAPIAEDGLLLTARAHEDADALAKALAKKLRTRP